jgi:hypothetical protein
MKTKSFIAMIMLGISLNMQGQSIQFGDALKKRFVEFKVEAKYSGNRRMKLHIKNRKKENLAVNLESGRMFMPETGNVQPFVVTRPVAIRLDPNEEKDIWVEAVCGNSGASSPKEGLNFVETKMGSDFLIQTLHTMNDERVISKSFYQNVVWHFTNKHQIGSIYSDSDDSLTQQKVTNLICQLEGIKSSWYKIKYEASESGDDMEFSGRPINAFGVLQFYNPERENLAVQITDTQGNVMNTVELYVNQPAGNTSIPIGINIGQFQTGKYVVRVVNEKNKVLKNWDIDVS